VKIREKEKWIYLNEGGVDSASSIALEGKPLGIPGTLKKPDERRGAKTTRLQGGRREGVWGYGKRVRSITSRSKRREERTRQTSRGVGIAWR